MSESFIGGRENSEGSAVGDGLSQAGGVEGGEKRFELACPFSNIDDVVVLLGRH
jgi:hypothetical protein